MNQTASHDLYDRLMDWLPQEIDETEVFALIKRAEAAFPQIHGDNLHRLIGQAYGIPI